MANQGPDRRTILEMLARVAAMSQFPGFRRWSFAGALDEHEHREQTAPAARSTPYQAQFFTPSEYKIVDQLTELVIPRDDTPGAHDAGVVEFIDLMASRDPDIQKRFRDGISILDALAVQTYGSDFLRLTQEQQEALLKKLSASGETEVEGAAFFKLLRTYTVMGYYTSRIGLEALDDPGLRFYSSSPECPHKDDPEHRHLPPPRY